MAKPQAKDEGVLVYSTLAGELPKMVEDGVGKCFVDLEAYRNLEKENEELKKNQNHILVT